MMENNSTTDDVAPDTTAAHNRKAESVNGHQIVDKESPMKRDKYGCIQPTPLQHQIADICCAIMRESLPTRQDKEVVTAIIISACTCEEFEGDRLTPIVQNVSHNCVLDIFGQLPPRASLQARRGNKEEPWNEEP
jgi:hypothetical protein